LAAAADVVTTEENSGGNKSADAGNDYRQSAEQGLSLEDAAQLKIRAPRSD
jgi:hypothetical protein